MQTTANPVTTIRQTITTSAVQLASDTFTQGVVLTALSTNTGIIYIGGQGVTSTTGYPLSPGQSISYAVNNTNLLYVVGTVAGDILVITGN